jgi:ribosomal protein S18 acetylase RimI-like enzyme
MTTKLRAASQSDCSSLAALSIEVWLATYIREGVNAVFAEYVLQEYTPARFAAILTDPDEHLFVSENVDGIDGYIRLTQGSACPVKTGSNVEIKTLYVQSRHHGLGKGALLLSKGLAYASQQGWPRPWLAVNSQNLNALNFYARHGFDPIGITQFQIVDAQYQNEVLQYSGTQTHPISA